MPIVGAAKPIVTTLIGFDMPTRLLRDGILTSEPVCSLGWAEEVFYRRLMSVVDDHGRFHALPKLLRASLYPLQIDKVSDADIGKWIAACEKAALVSVYPAQDGKRYLQILKFGQQVRSKSKFPDPAEGWIANDSNCLQLPADAHLDVVVCVDGCGAGKARKRAPHKKPIPDDFGISDRVQKWAAERQIHNLPQHLEYFVSRAKAKAYAYVDWDEAFMCAIRDDWAKIGKGAANGGTDL